MEYRVRWEIDVEADSPEAAARQAQEYQRDPEAIVGVFECLEWKPLTREPAKYWIKVDLDVLDGKSVD